MTLDYAAAVNACGSQLLSDITTAQYAAASVIHTEIRQLLIESILFGVHNPTQLPIALI